MKMETGDSPAADPYVEGFNEGVRQALQRCRLVLASGNVTATACITALGTLKMEPRKEQPPRFHCARCARYFYSSPAPDRCPICAAAPAVSAA